jgi:hypothetical protein
MFFFELEIVQRAHVLSQLFQLRERTFYELVKTREEKERKREIKRVMRDEDLDVCLFEHNLLVPSNELSRSEEISKCLIGS